MSNEKEEQAVEQVIRKCPISPLLTDCVKELKLKNGMVLKLSTLDAKFLGLWFCNEKKHTKCKCRKLKKYGDVELFSECYVKQKPRSITF